MTKKEKLQRRARKSASFGGHQLGVFKDLGERVSEAVCRFCGMECHVNISPLPNEIDISGQAVALNCKGYQKGVVYE